MTGASRGAAAARLDGWRDYPVYLLAFALPIIPLARIVVSPLLGMLKEVVIVAALGACVLGGLHRRLDAMRLSFGTALILLFIGYVLLHALITRQGAHAVLESVRYILLYPFMALVFVSSGRRGAPDPGAAGRRVRILMILIFASAVLVSAIGMYQKYLSPDFMDLYGGRTVHGSYLGIKNLRIVSTMENPITLGLFMQVGIVASVFLWGISRSLRGKAAAVAGAGLFCFTAIMTISRSAFLIMGAAGALLCARSMVLGGLRSKLAMSALLAIAGGIAWALWSRYTSDFSFLDVLNNRLFELLDSNALESDPRIVTWDQKFVPFLQSSPVEILFGRGLGHIGWGEGSFVMENGYLAVFFELGALGVFLFVLLLARAAHNAVLLGMGEDAVFRAFGASMQVFLLAYAIAMVLADVHMNLPLVFYFWAFYAASEVLVAASRRAAPAPERA